MATNDTLVQMIETLVQEKTFSLDALEAIKVLRDKAVKLQEELDATKRTLAESRAAREALNAEKTTLNAEKTTLNEQLNGWTTRETELLNREKTMFALEQRTAVAEAKADAFLTSMKITFAPNLVRNSVQGYAGSNRNTTHTDCSRNINETISDNHGENESRSTTTVDGYARAGDPDATGGAGVQPKNTL